MKKLTSPLLFVLTIVMAATASDNACLFRITTKRNDDWIEQKIARGHAIFFIHSPFGISNAVIERTGEAWPASVTLHLKLKDLENFQVSNGKVVLNAAVANRGRSTRVWKNGDEETLLQSTNPYWMDIRRVEGDKKTTKPNPQMKGRFVIDLPKAFFETNPQSITINWIDFYRH